ncbi:GyrI-like domain-containing protein [Edaphobacter modestus]|uniref:Effector-binding domain-containing protein n=1 Tax=Edaphobacter modestus TaxID=388466 RepID=A0A4Q7YVJ1_9BACT|nr:GyrI-like domain-containing protein [Edaphobacter modestus]RZU41690.1 effector-binding domain-containing protein [Edaphobacter modestus]
MITEPEIVESPAQTIAFIHTTVPRAEIMAAMNAGLEELSAVLKAQAVVPTGPWFTYHFRRPNETFDFRICFPVDAEIKPTGRVEAGQLAAATVARTIYSGNYTGLAAAWGQFMNWIEEHRYNTREDLWERYLVNPDTSAQPEDWRTELNRPLA